MEREKKLKKIFAVSDIHGCAPLLEQELNRAGFDREDPDHLLIVMGDLFDRGGKNRDVLSFLNRIRNKQLLRGNHEDILYEVLITGRVTELQVVNGTLATLSEFFPYYHGESFVDMSEELHSLSRRMLGRLINSMWDYFETERYILTHGWLTEDANEADFRYASAAQWHHARWMRWYNYYPHFPIPGEKTLVVGHTPTIYACKFDASRSIGDHGIFYGKNMIAIDGAAVNSSCLNVLVFEDLVTEPLSFTAELSAEEYGRIEEYNTRVWLTLFKGERREYRRGDRLTLVNRDDPSLHLTYRISATRRYDTFAEAEDEYFPSELGFDRTYPAGFLAAEMRKQYTLDEVLEYGALAVELS